MTRAETTEILKSLKDLHSGQNELRLDFKRLEGQVGADILGLENSLRGEIGGLRTDFQRLETKVDRIENNFGNDIKRLEYQGQSHHADIMKMKEEIIGAFEATVRLPDVSEKVNQHDRRIENLEQQATVFKINLESINKSNL